MHKTKCNNNGLNQSAKTPSVAAEEGQHRQESISLMGTQELVASSPCETPVSWVLVLPGGSNAYLTQKAPRIILSSTHDAFLQD